MGRLGDFWSGSSRGSTGLAFEALLSPIHGSAMGAPGYPPLTMFTILLLKQWRTRSDPAAEEAVRDRLSFRRFCGLPQGASRRSLRRAARNVGVFHRPRGTLSMSRSHLGAQPRRRVMLVFVQVSSMKTRRLGSMRP